MVIEHFKRGIEPVAKRFHREGRMLPDDVVYHSSWMSANGERCFQLVQSRDARSVEGWTQRWADLCDFEIVPVLTSREFWNATNRTDEQPTSEE